jgi:2,3,4,5-tetrahydropyridine-2,6-dicarboxylate N-succinyltransferase
MESKVTSTSELETRIEASFADPDQLDSEAVEETIALLDQGVIRVAEPSDDEWIVNEWVKQAVLLYFRVRPMETIESGWFEYRDKVPVKNNFEKLGVRVVPPATARYGSYLGPGAVLMPSYVNIGARVGSGTMVDTWATVGSCAQIGENVHLSGGVGIGGVLEPVQAAPVVVEDGAFVGSRCIIVEGARVGKEAVLGANVVITRSTPIIDVTSTEAVEYRGHVPARAIVIPGTRKKTFPAGEYELACGLIIGWRNPGMEGKVQVNDILRDHGAGV